MNSFNQTSKENILKELAFMSTFEEISTWVEKNSNGCKFIANPASASDTERLICLFTIQKPLALALKNITKRRVNGRDKRILEAIKENNYSTIAYVLASAAGTYWRDHGFLKKYKV